MTKVNATVKAGKYSLECRGHADTVEVCSAISALCYTLAGCLINNANVRDLSYDLTPGRANITYSASDIRADEEFRVCLIGLLQIRNSHPKEIIIVQNVF